MKKKITKNNFVGKWFILVNFSWENNSYPAKENCVRQHTYNWIFCVEIPIRNISWYTFSFSRFSKVKVVFGQVRIRTCNDCVRYVSSFFLPDLKDISSIWFFVLYPLAIYTCIHTTNVSLQFLYCLSHLARG